MASKNDEIQKPEAFLRVDHTGALSPDVQRDVNELHFEGVAWSANNKTLAAKLEKLANDSQTDSTTIGELKKSAREIGKFRDNQHREGTNLAWRRKELNSAIIPDAKRSVEQRKEEFETLIKAKMDKLIAEGVLFGMPGRDSDAGRYQLRVKILQDDLQAIAARGRVAIAEEELSAAEALALIPPSSKCFDRSVPQTGVEMADLILRQELSPIEEPELSEPAQTIREMLGLKGAPLTDTHFGTLREIQKALGVGDHGNGMNVANFRRMSAAVGERVAQLMQELPATQPRNVAIQTCRECNRDERSGVAKPRTTYLDPKTDEMVAAN